MIKSSLQPRTARTLSDFSIWYAAQAEPVRIAVIGAVVGLWCGLFAGAVSVTVAWVQGRIAHRAVKAQERTIYLSLIGRRAAWLDYAITTWSVWIDQQEHRIEAILTNQPLPTDEPLRAIGNCRREARWLFGPEIDAFLEQLEVAVRNYSASRMAVRELGLMEPAELRKIDGHEREQAFQQSLTRLMTLRADISNKTRPYLYVGDIRATGLP